MVLTGTGDKQGTPVVFITQLFNVRMSLRRCFLLLLLLLGVAAGADVRAVVVLTETGECQGCTQQPRYKEINTTDFLF
mgnify:CR=1 FL=1